MKSRHITTKTNLQLGPRSARTPSKGAALVVTLILLMLLSAGAVAIVLLTSSDTMINGYYRNYRGSFYAADSGANVVVEAMKNAITTTANDAVNPPLPMTGALPTTPPNGTVTAAYTPYMQGYYKVGDPGSWNGQFKIVSVTWGTPTVQESANPSDSYACAPATPGATPPPTCNGKANDNDFQWVFNYPFTIVVQGQSAGTEQEQITEQGVITYRSLSGTAGTGGLPSFARWGGYITQFSDCQGPLVPGTMTGPFFTDGQWNFGNYTNPGYTFTDSVAQVGTNVSWWTNNCTDSPNAPKGFNKPNFEGGFQAGAAPVTPPTNSYSQAQAILDGAGTSCTSSSCTATPPTQSQMNQELKTINNSAYPSSGTPSSGVYIPYYTNSSGQNVYGASGGGAAGGFYVAGDAGITLAAGTDSGGKPTEIYTISQTTGSGWRSTTTTTTITVDPFANSGAGSTTVASSGSPTLTLSGMPSQIDPDTGASMVEQDPSTSPMFPTMIYVNGQITGLSGTVANQQAITIATGSISGGSSDTDISITGDLTYTSLPVSTSSDTLNASTNAGVLGVYTNGNINLYPNSSGSNRGNLTVDAALAAIGGVNGDAGFETPGNSIGTWTILGGRSEDHAHSVSISQGNTIYDRRFGTGSFGPPWFPTAVPQPGSGSVAPSSPGASVQRTFWQESRP